MLDDIPWGLEEAEPTTAHSKLPYMPFYVGTCAELQIVIDEDDYMWASQWRWGINPSKNGKKLYIRRTARAPSGRFMSVYLHKVICHRAHGLPPTPNHIIADHRNGNTLDCRRHNLGWATPSENRQNYNGLFAIQVAMDLKTKGARLLRVHHFGRRTSNEQSLRA